MEKIFGQETSVPPPPPPPPEQNTYLMPMLAVDEIFSLWNYAFLKPRVRDLSAFTARRGLAVLY